MSEYKEFLDSKIIRKSFMGFPAIGINPMLFKFQQDIVSFGCRKGRAAFFENCGLGKTAQQLEWARQVCNHTDGNVLVLAPLAVSRQTQKEGAKFGIPVHICSSQDDVANGINVTNYEKLSRFDPSFFHGVVADESGIMKSWSGKIKQQMCDMWADTPFRLVCTATPAPNDFEELGNQAEFLGICSRSEMLSMFFINDTADTGTWRLKKHAVDAFWKWVCTWAVMIQQPTDLGYESAGFELPGLEYTEHIIKSTGPKNGFLFTVEAKTLSDRRNARRSSLKERCELAAKIVNESDEQFLVWCDLNDESVMLSSLIKDAVQVTGSDTDEHKEKSLIDFAEGKIRVLVSKPKIAGYGLNLQSCHNQVFVGLSDSFEAMYQAVRRSYRFGQKEKVLIHIITHESEGAVLRNIKRKEADFLIMTDAMTRHMADMTKKEITNFVSGDEIYNPSSVSGENWTMHNADCVDVLKEIPENSIHYSIFSPPFSNLFCYSNSSRDIGNCRDDKEFLDHFDFIVRELYRVIMPGRLLSFHVMNLMATITKDGYIGVKDLRGDLIRVFQGAGFIFHSEVCIWKDPLVQATRTKVLTLAHKQISKDASRCGQGLPDYVVTMRKPGENPEPVSKGRGFETYIGDMDEPKERKTNDPRTNKYSHHVWQRYASPVWFDINQTRTLNAYAAREKEDERHMCPLQLDVIERCLELWTNEGDTVLSPFGGIGSEGFCSLQMGRKYIGIELKKSYFDAAIKNLATATRKDTQLKLPGVV